MSEPICDFCSDVRVAWAYPCESFTSIIVAPGGVGVQANHNGWAACNTCHELIEADRREQLVERSLQGFDIEPALMDVMKANLANLHDEFFQNRLGPCEAFS
jgi:hypothetical protein